MDCSTAFTLQPVCSQQVTGILTPPENPPWEQMATVDRRAPLGKFPRFTHNSAGRLLPHR